MYIVFILFILFVLCFVEDDDNNDNTSTKQTTVPKYVKSTNNTDNTTEATYNGPTGPTGPTGPKAPYKHKIITPVFKPQAYVDKTPYVEPVLNQLTLEKEKEKDIRGLSKDYDENMMKFYKKYHIFRAPANVNVCLFCTKVKDPEIKQGNRILFFFQQMAIEFLFQKISCIIPATISYGIGAKLFDGEPTVKGINIPPEEIFDMISLYTYIESMPCTQYRFVCVPTAIKLLHAVTLIFDRTTSPIVVYALDSNQVDVTAIQKKLTDAGFVWGKALFQHKGDGNYTFQLQESKHTKSPLDPPGYCAFWAWLICEIVMSGDQSITDPESLIKKEIELWGNASPEILRRLIVDFTFSRCYQICFTEPYKSYFAGKPEHSSLQAKGVKYLSMFLENPSTASKKIGGKKKKEKEKQSRDVQKIKKKQ